MLLYFLCLFIVLASAYFAQEAWQSIWTRCFFIFTAFCSMVLFAGLRHKSVGSDTATYVARFEHHSGSFEYFNEAGYYILQNFTSILSDKYWALLVTIAVVTVFCYMRSIYMFSVNPTIALFVFITMGYYTFFFNGARQGIACAIYTLGFGALRDGNFKRYSFWVLLAFLFHKSIIIALPLYFLFRQKTSVKFIFQMIVIAMGTIFFFGPVLRLATLVSDKYVIYQELEARGGFLLTLFYVLLSIFFMLRRPTISAKDLKSYDFFLNMLMFGSTVYVVVALSGGYVEITRLAFYFQISSIFLWPIVFRNIREISMKQFLGAGFLLSHLMYFYIFTNRMADLVPYQFNEAVLDWL